MISTHNIPDGLNVKLISIVPSTYWIPSINEDAKAVGERCALPLTSPVDKKSTTIVYAVPKERSGKKYVLLTFPDSATFRIGSEQQRTDEYGNRLEPDIQRTLLTVRAEEIANQIEKQYKKFGVITIEGEEPTDAELRQALDLTKTWQLAFINDVNKNYARYGAREATPLAVFEANDLFTRGLLREMPIWATLEARETVAEDLKPCPNCQARLLPESISCRHCGAILDWPGAVRLGLRSRHDVPEEFAHLFQNATAERPRPSKSA
ncbi:MAG: zinc ribbon domain-containing protein [Patescibacteria group bacterium]|nr:zinc ribbon domain-containing protein [Patescibacteria group bacterium]